MVKAGDKAEAIRFLDGGAFELSRCAADAAAWAMIDLMALGQNLGWSLY